MINNGQDVPRSAVTRCSGDDGRKLEVGEDPIRARRDSTLPSFWRLLPLCNWIGWQIERRTGEGVGREMAAWAWLNASEERGARSALCAAGIGLGNRDAANSGERVRGGRQLQGTQEEREREHVCVCVCVCVCLCVCVEAAMGGREGEEIDTNRWIINRRAMGLDRDFR
ncbi:hypothetical protein LX36DRAFT_64729 [Colletotrichum falcatum]|nr:hypothetical protein LX36DRAFT_64729 [Colletotrichum falcatum]